MLSIDFAADSGLLQCGVDKQLNIAYAVFSEHLIWHLLELFFVNGGG